MPGRPGVLFCAAPRRSARAIRNGQNVLGARTANHNSHTIGIEHEGIYVSQNDRVAAVLLG